MRGHALILSFMALAASVVTAAAREDAPELRVFPSTMRRNYLQGERLDITAHINAWSPFEPDHDVVLLLAGDSDEAGLRKAIDRLLGMTPRNRSGARAPGS